MHIPEHAPLPDELESAVRDARGFPITETLQAILNDFALAPSAKRINLDNSPNSCRIATFVVPRETHANLATSDIKVQLNGDFRSIL